MADDLPKKPRKLPWHRVDEALTGLGTAHEHVVDVQREAIPLIFVPGIMGSRLRRAGTDGSGDGPDGLPNLRWDVGTEWSTLKWMMSNLLGASPRERKQLIIGDAFSPDFLEVDVLSPSGDGWRGVIPDYRPFLELLRDHDWGPVSRAFVLPVYAHGYNWTDDNDRSGAKLAERIAQVIAEAREVVGTCEKVILVTHSMGGLVARAASRLHGAEGSILGIVHGVQPTDGATAAYWRMKAGFESSWAISSMLASSLLGSSGRHVTPVLGNAPGGLELLPTKNFRTADGARRWLRIEDDDGVPVLELPAADPYAEIYGVRAVVRPSPGRPQGPYWGLVDPDLLDPGRPATGSGRGSPNEIAREEPMRDPWAAYRRLLGTAASFHDRLGNEPHPRTHSYAGAGHETCDRVRFRSDNAWFERDVYPTRGFRGYFEIGDGDLRKSTLQDPEGDGDGTVPLGSSKRLFRGGKEPPGDATLDVEHQPSYEAAAAQAYTIAAILALCRVRYQEFRGDD